MHAFTPYFSLYAYYESIKEAYGTMVYNISFLELGLSADSYLANLVSELENICFLSNGDAHSYWLYRMGREFNKFDVPPNYKGLKAGKFKIQALFFVVGFVLIALRELIKTKQF